MTVSPLVAFLVSSYPILVVGDFNIHHPLPDPLRSHCAEELATSFPYFPGRQSWALVSSINLASTRASPLAALADHLFLIFSLLPPRCFHSARHGTPPSLPPARTTSPFRLYFHSCSLLPLLAPQIGYLPIGPPLSCYSKTLLFLNPLLFPPGFPLKPGSTDTLHTLPVSSPPTPPPNALPIV